MSWSTADSYRLYRFEHWAEGYFAINEQGHAVARQLKANQHEVIDLYALAKSLKQKGLDFPVLVRLTDILQDRLSRLHQQFDQARAQHAYSGRYWPVYPIKVNQQQTVVSHLLNPGDHAVGLEVGSKPELIASLSMARPNSLIICNGYKDREFIRLALMARQLGHRVLIVLEKPSEVRLIEQQAQLLGVSPELGLRIRLHSKGTGNWQNTGGDKSKFGFSAAGVLDLLNRLEQAGLTQAVSLLHFHMGSQITHLDHFRSALQEAMHYFVQLSQAGLKLTMLDVGGGLAVDYEGSSSDSYFSMNYGLDQYADLIVAQVKAKCAEHQLAEPDIITECGRAMTAHHGLIITNVIDHETRPELMQALETIKHDAKTQDIALHSELVALLEELTPANCPSSFMQAKQIAEQAFHKFIAGQFTMSHLSTIEVLYFQVCRQILQVFNGQAESLEHSALLEELHQALADKYFCNLSFFQSLPDVWGLGQVFPIVPLHRLDTNPDKRVILKDLTCDSDGRIDTYTEQNGIRSTLRLHQRQADEDYLLGIFLVGAYQEILGDMHNLFGDTHTIDVSIDAAGDFVIHNIEPGDKVSTVLDLVHYNMNHIMQAIDQQIEASGLDDNAKETIQQQVSKSMLSYTYLKS